MKPLTLVRKLNHRILCKNWKQKEMKILIKKTRVSEKKSGKGSRKRYKFYCWDEYTRKKYVRTDCDSKNRKERKGLRYLET